MRRDSLLSEIGVESSPAPVTARTEAAMFPEMGMMMENMKNMFNGALAEVRNLVTQTKEELAESQKMEAQVARSEVPEKEECMDEVSECVKCKGTKINKKGKPCKRCAATGECLADHVKCFKCKGTKIHPKKNKPCGKCKQTGSHCLSGLGEILKEAKEEIKALVNEDFMKVFREHK